MEKNEEKKVDPKEELKKLKLLESDFEVMAMLYQFYYLTFDHIKSIYQTQDRATRYRLTKLENAGYISKFTVGSKKDKTYLNIYTLDKGGFFSVTDYFTQEKFNEESALRLKQTYRHSLAIADILFSYKKYVLNALHEDVEIYSEKRAYHFYGDDKDYKSVLRPDGAIVLAGKCMFIEYENSQKLRSLYKKIERYNYYANDMKIQYHPEIEVTSKEISLIFIYNTDRKKENAKVMFNKIFSQNKKSNNLRIALTTLTDFVNNPLDKTKIEVI